MDMSARNLTDKEIDILVQCFIDPPPWGFTEYERKQWLDYMKNPNAFERMPARSETARKFFTYDDD